MAIRRYGGSFWYGGARTVTDLSYHTPWTFKARFLHSRKSGSVENDRVGAVSSRASRNLPFHVLIVFSVWSNRALKIGPRVSACYLVSPTVCVGHPMAAFGRVVVSALCPCRVVCPSIGGLTLNRGRLCVRQARRHSFLTAASKWIGDACAPPPLVSTV